MPDGRRTDSRRRIRATALQLFTEQGYELTTLTQVAQRLGITRAAVLHHYGSKDQLLTSSYADLAAALREIVGAAHAQRPGSAVRREAIDGFAQIVRGELGPALVCAQVNEHALAGLPMAADLRRALDGLARVIAPGDDVPARMRGRLALAALVMGEVRRRELGGRQDERRAAALDIAHDLTRG